MGLCPAGKPPLLPEVTDMTQMLAAAHCGSDNAAALDQRLSDALIGSSYFSRRHAMSFRADRGCVTLHGHVKSFFEKQMAQEVLRHVEGVTQIENQLEVASWR